MAYPELAAALAALTRDGGDANRVVLTGGEGFLVIEGAPGRDRFRVLAAGSAQVRTSAEQVHALRLRGFTKVVGTSSLGRVVVDPEPEAFADELVATLGELWSGEPAVELRLASRPAVKNERLHDAMRALAKARDMPARNAVYGSLLGADLLVVVDETGPKTVDDLSGWDVKACFSDYDQLLAWDPRAPATRQLPGYQLFPMLAQLPRVGSLLINPRGRVGGELYRNEVLALARAAVGRR